MYGGFCGRLKYVSCVDLLHRTSCMNECGLTIYTDVGNCVS
jgi:hypothetical protein